MGITVELSHVHAISVHPRHFFLPPGSDQVILVEFNREIINHFPEGLNELDLFCQATIKQTNIITGRPSSALPRQSPELPQYVSPIQYIPQLPDPTEPPPIILPPPPTLSLGIWKEERFNGAPITPSAITDIQEIFAQGPYSTSLVSNIYYQDTIPAPTTIRWTGDFDFTAAEYMFEVVADDGVRVWLDNELILESAWGLQQTPYTQTRKILMSNRSFNLRVEYFNGYTYSQISFRWFLAGTSTTKILPPIGPVIGDPVVPTDDLPFVPLNPTWRNGVTRQTLSGYPPADWINDGADWWFPPVSSIVDFNYSTLGGNYTRDASGPINRASAVLQITIDSGQLSDWTYDWDFGNTYYTLDGDTTNLTVNWVLTLEDLTAIDAGQVPVRTVILNASRGSEYQTKTKQIYLYGIIVTDTPPSEGRASGPNIIDPLLF